MTTNNHPPMDLAEAALLIPMKHATLRVWLFRHKDQFPPRYRRGPKRMKVRVLAQQEIEAIRAMLCL